MEKYLEYINTAFIFICPGYLTILVWGFCRDKSFSTGKEKLFRSIVLSGMYFYLYNWVKGINLQEIELDKIELRQVMITILISILFPVIINFLTHIPRFEDFLTCVKINTSTYGDVISDYLKLGDKGAYALLYLDQESIAYRGGVILYDDKRIALENYTRFVCIEGSYQKDPNFKKEETENVIILEYSRITRMEFERASSKNKNNDRRDKRIKIKTKNKNKKIEKGNKPM